MICKHGIATIANKSYKARLMPTTLIRLGVVEREGIAIRKQRRRDMISEHRLRQHQHAKSHFNGLIFALCFVSLFWSGEQKSCLQIPLIICTDNHRQHHLTPSESIIAQLCELAKRESICDNRHPLMANKQSCGL